MQSIVDGIVGGATLLASTARDHDWELTISCGVRTKLPQGSSLVLIQLAMSLDL